MDTLSSSPSPSRSDDTWERITRPIAPCLNLQGPRSLRELLQSRRLYEDAKENNKERTKDNETEM